MMNFFRFALIYAGIVWMLAEAVLYPVRENRVWYDTMKDYAGTDRNSFTRDEVIQMRRHLWDELKRIRPSVILPGILIFAGLLLNERASPKRTEATGSPEHKKAPGAQH